MNGNVMELLAAEALLLLHGGSTRRSPTCLPVSETTTNRQSSSDSQETNVEKAPQKSLFNGYGSTYQPINLSPIKNCEQETQTDEGEHDHNTAPREIKKLHTIISTLYAKIISLEIQLNTRHRNIASPSAGDLDPDVSTDVLMIQQCNQPSNLFNNNRPNKRKRNSSSSYSANSIAMDKDAIDYDWEDDKLSRQFEPHVTEMVPIGEGTATVPASLLKRIDWSSYTAATRKLLTAVFTRDVLATHSLTGKPSPAFPGRAAKKRLDSEKVDDIVQTVVERCGVTESIVRTSITNKCADESKMFRLRLKQENKKRQVLKMNQENVPPSPDQSY